MFIMTEAEAIVEAYLLGEYLSVFKKLNTPITLKLRKLATIIHKSQKVEKQITNTPINDDKHEAILLKRNIKNTQKMLEALNEILPECRNIAKKHDIKVVGKTLN